MKKTIFVFACIFFGILILPGQSLNLKIGIFRPIQDSDLWDINHDNLIYSKSELINTNFAVQYEFFLSRYASLGIESGNYSRTIYSEYRDFQWEDDGSPVEQNFHLRITPLELTINLYPQGHRQKFLPYIGFGPGIYFWRYEQWGYFILFPSMDIQDGSAVTNSVAFGLHARLGMVLRMSRYLGISFEGKYHYAKGELSGDFEDFEKFDLSGFSVMVGLNLYFR